MQGSDREVLSHTIKQQALDGMCRCFRCKALSRQFLFPFAALDQAGFFSKRQAVQLLVLSTVL
jgi:hypothetical protein